MTPALELATTYVLDEGGRIVSTREPVASRGPRFVLIRSFTACAWAVRDDVPDDVAGAISSLERLEPPLERLESAPVHAARYLELTSGHQGFEGPAFHFPELPHAPSNVIQVHDERELMPHFPGFRQGDIATGRGPVAAIAEAGQPVSICFCARRSERAAAAGVETARSFRGRGYAPRVVAAWAALVRANRLTPLYSAAWSNAASLQVARKLGLVPHATFWSAAE